MAHHIKPQRGGGLRVGEGSWNTDGGYALLGGLQFCLIFSPKEELQKDVFILDCESNSATIDGDGPFGLRSSF